ncbi:hypothetical protein [Burkholderia sp. B21-007]|uniref:hypothetical protein n=1 Tax=Burkholderia sp. B21-007 TaxID=2890407 RepID=UPI001E4E50D4|nr:hypothetical protein [Burkholderia sp. B21-007]UEP28259.1 hypothetical protein LMA01_02180 [Burkholderia sp. B21-007]
MRSVVAGGLRNDVGPNTSCVTSIEANTVSAASSSIDAAAFSRIGLFWTYTPNSTPLSRYSPNPYSLYWSALSSWITIWIVSFATVSPPNVVMRFSSLGSAVMSGLNTKAAVASPICVTWCAVVPVLPGATSAARPASVM